jgi:hypothetical protein
MADHPPSRHGVFLVREAALGLDDLQVGPVPASFIRAYTASRSSTFRHRCIEPGRFAIPFVRSPTGSWNWMRSMPRPSMLIVAYRRVATGRPCDLPNGTLSIVPAATGSRPVRAP